MKRTLAISAAALGTLVGTAVPAAADDLGSVTYQDRWGDAPARADIHATRETRMHERMTLTTAVGNLWGRGRYVVSFESYRHGLARAVVKKELGKPPVATLSYIILDSGEEPRWTRSDCALGVTWDTERDLASVRIPYACAPVELHHWATRSVLVESGGARDEMFPEPADWPGYREVS